jgi:hypothetical protein
MLPTLLTVNMYTLQALYKLQLYNLCFDSNKLQIKLQSCSREKIELPEHNKRLSSDKRQRRGDFSKRDFSSIPRKWPELPTPLFLLYFSEIPSRNPFPLLPGIKESNSFLFAHITLAFSREYLRTF